ncbi:MAG: hypothetical protein HKN81_03900, partial [Gammaproteobacteria bacterium]|nr:hypothetical protein [Gammaproteobacteria bacterium]
MIDLRDQSGFTVEEQEVSNFRTAVLTESRVIDLGTKYWNPAYFVAVDELQAALPRSVEEKDASWDRSGGNAREPARIKIRAPEGSEVFYST